MKSEKISLKFFKILAIVFIMIGVGLLISAIATLSGEEDKTVIMTNNSVTVVDNNEIWYYLEIFFGVIVLLLGVGCYIFARKHMNDEIEIINENVICNSCNMKYEFTLQEIDSSNVKKGLFLQLFTIKRKNNANELLLTIAEPDKINQYILDKKAELELKIRKNEIK